MTPKKPQTVEIPWHRQPIMIPVVGVLLIVVMCGFRWGPDNSSAESTSPTAIVAAMPAPQPVVVERQRKSEPNRGILINGNDNELHFYDGLPTARELVGNRRHVRCYNNHRVVVLERNK